LASTDDQRHVSNMSQLATTSTPKTHKQRKQRAISAKMLRALRAIEDGSARTQRAAATLAGVHETALSRLMQSTKGRLALDEMRKKNLALGALRASKRIVELADSDSAHVSFRASERILEASGDLPSGGNGVQVNVNNRTVIGSFEVMPGYLISLDRPDTQRTSDAPVIEHEAEAVSASSTANRPFIAQREEADDIRPTRQPTLEGER
jgi:hypothetical protein